MCSVVHRSGTCHNSVNLEAGGVYVDFLSRREGERGRLSYYLSSQPNTQLPWIGYRIFKWLLLLAGIVFLALVLFAVITFPTGVPNSVPVEQRFQVLQEARAAWLGQLKDLAQVFLLTPIFPLMGAVLGYIFGVSSSPVRTVPSTSTEADVPDEQTQGDSLETTSGT
jgi:hypothetical protein